MRFMALFLTVFKFSPLSEETVGRSKKLSDELKVENLPHSARPAIHRTVLSVVNVRVELSPRKQKSDTGTFY